MMKTADLVLALAFCLIITSGRATEFNDVGYSWYTAVDDKSFTDSSLFLTTAVSLLACANLCSLDPSCLTFTFVKEARMCQGHYVYFSTSSDHNVTDGARSYVKVCRPDKVYTLDIPSLGVNEQVACYDNWIVIMRRYDGDVDFYRDWSQYRAGFGNATGNYWIGLETVHKLTASQNYLLTVDLGEWDDSSISAYYTNFSLGPEADFYTLLSADFLGGIANDSLDFHIGFPFSTYDEDHDTRPTKNCAERLHGAWWYLSCAKSNLFGRFPASRMMPARDGLSWKSWTGSNSFSMKTAQMRIRPASGELLPLS